MKFKHILFGVLLVLSVMLMKDVSAVTLDNIPLELNNINKNSNQSETDRFIFELTPENVENPMPEGTENGVYRLVVTKDGTYSLCSIDFDEPGVYKYYVRQVEGDNPRCKYDDTEYTLIISVENSLDYTTLETYITITTGDMEEKCKTLYFENDLSAKLQGDIELPNTSDIGVYGLIVIAVISTFGIIKIQRKMCK